MTDLTPFNRKRKITAADLSCLRDQLLKRVMNVLDIQVGTDFIVSGEENLTEEAQNQLAAEEDEFKALFGGRDSRWGVQEDKKQKRFLHVDRLQRMLRKTLANPRLKRQCIRKGKRRNRKSLNYTWIPASP